MLPLCEAIHPTQDPHLAAQHAEIREEEPSVIGVVGRRLVIDGQLHSVPTGQVAISLRVQHQGAVQIFHGLCAETEQAIGQEIRNAIAER